ncbi:MAG: GDP-L-fucose synthase [Candidatus Cloacimonas sp.]|jgi:GDP-L-fucose synthase|nr:GDP-L-fucose synthase [Candidatus Cloacimonas sp.]
MKPSDKIYVAGNTGLVGSALIRKLKENGFSNLVFSPYPQYDLRSQNVVEQFFNTEKPDYVFVAAAKVGGINANSIYPAEFLFDNLIIEANIINSAHKAGVKKLLFLGSSCIYPKLCPQPIKEEYLLTGELEPTNEPYAIAKIAGIKMCQYYRKQYSDNYISAMPTNLFGDGDNYHLDNSHVLPAMVRKMYLAKLFSENDMEGIKQNFYQHEGIQLADEDVDKTLAKYGILKKDGLVTLSLWGTGQARREFLFVDDLADALLYLMKTYNEELHINVGTGKDSKIIEIAEMIKELVGFAGMIQWDTNKPDGTPQKLLDVSRINNFGWEPQHSFSQALKLTIDHYISQSETD